MIRRLAFAAISAVAFHTITSPHMLGMAMRMIAAHARVHHATGEAPRLHREASTCGMNYDRCSDGEKESD